MYVLVLDSLVIPHAAIWRIVEKLATVLLYSVCTGSVHLNYGKVSSKHLGRALPITSNRSAVATCRRLIQALITFSVARENRKLVLFVAVHTQETIRMNIAAHLSA